MSRQLVSHSPDLQRLQSEGYAIDVRDTYLIIAVPYATAQGTVAVGRIVSELTTSGDATTTPNTHVVYFVGAAEGDLPCDDKGRVLEDLISQRGPIQLGGDLTASCSFSHKPTPSYADYFDKMSTYADMLVAYAQVHDRQATAKTFPPVAMDDEESVFRYLDSATSRSGIGAATEKLRLRKVVIIGLGGSGSYILDLVSKTPVEAIHIYDEDVLLTHNAFRSPGAATLDELRGTPKKVHHFQTKYDAMHRNVIAHDRNIDGSNIDDLRDADFVFVSIDSGSIKRVILEKLQEFGVPFIDVGMGIYQTGGSLGGIVRTTTSVPNGTEHVWAELSFAEDEDDEYERNIQIADLNMLNAALAVIRWKRLFGFYLDFDRELSCYYTIDGNYMLNKDQMR